MALRVRSLTSEEQATLERLARARTAPAGHVKRARVVLLAQEGLRIPEIAARLNMCAKTARLWLHRFNTLGVRGLEESPRAGRPRIYPPEQVAVVIETALTNPETLGLPFACWTLDRLETYINEIKGIGIKRSRMSEIFIAEGLGWRHEETWFGERVDPDFAKKRGPSKRSIPPRPPKV